MKNLIISIILSIILFSCDEIVSNNVKVKRSDGRSYTDCILVNGKILISQTGSYLKVLKRWTN